MKAGNVNPRIGVLLRQYGATVRLFNVLNPKFGHWGLQRFNREWPELRRRMEIPGYGRVVQFEWWRLLRRREQVLKQRTEDGGQRTAGRGRRAEG